MRRAWLVCEFAALFVVAPVLLWAFAGRLAIYLALWGAGLYALINLRLQAGFSWRLLWHGVGWSVAARRLALWRFMALALVLALMTLWLVPGRFFRFPLDNPKFWAVVMVLYPLLSVVPQALFFRCFYFSRYGGAAVAGWGGALLNGAVFGLSHLILNNWIAPLACVAGGAIFARSFQQHRALKWAVAEHAAYGCFVFTVGIGFYFFTGNWRH